MTVLVGILLLLVLAVGLVLGLLNVLRELFVQDAQVGQTGPLFHDPGPIFHDQCDDQREARSQFAWQSRSHCRGPD